jgi:hypothetical protein
MAINVTIRDVENYPDISKTVTVDQTTMVPVGSYGDEKWLLSFVTSAYSDNVARTGIQNIYVQEMKAGWVKSSGLVDFGSTVVVSATSKTLGIDIDNSTGAWYYIELTEGVYGPDALARDMEDLIRSIPDGSLWNSNDDPLAYINAQVEYSNGKFKIVSGSVASEYTGTSQTSVEVTYSGSDTLYYDVGFDLGIDSYTIATTGTNERLVTSAVVSGTDTVVITTTAGLSAGDCMAITDNVNTDYFQIIDVVSLTDLTVASGTGFDAIHNDYNISVTPAKVQLLRVSDVDQEPSQYHDMVDSIMRWGIMSVTNQIDFSS